MSLDEKKLRIAGIKKIQTMAENQPEIKLSEEKELLQQLFSSDFWKKNQLIGTTVNMPFELNTEPIIQQAFLEGKRIAVPKVIAKGQMIFIEVFPETSYTISKFGVNEPSSGNEIKSNQLEGILVPGVLFNKDGYRIGFGGGYYDRFLAEYHGETASLVFSYQLLDPWEADEYDQPVKKLFLIN